MLTKLRVSTISLIACCICGNCKHVVLSINIVFRILEVNGKLVVGAGRSDLARLLAVAPDSAQIVVLRKGESLTALRTLRSDNLRLTHRIGYLEEQVRDLLTPTRTEVSTEPATTNQKNVQVHFTSSEINFRYYHFSFLF